MLSTVRRKDVVILGAGNYAVLWMDLHRLYGTQPFSHITSKKKYLLRKKSLSVNVIGLRATRGIHDTPSYSGPPLVSTLLSWTSSFTVVLTVLNELEIRCLDMSIPDRSSRLDSVAEETSGLPSVSVSPHHRLPHNPSPSPMHRPITGYTSMGSPIYGRLRSHSTGNAPRSPMCNAHNTMSISPIFAGTSALLKLPNLPNLPPEPDQTQRSMEAAITSERLRAKQMEEQEADMTADELRAVRSSLLQGRRDTLAMQFCNFRAYVSGLILFIF